MRTAASAVLHQEQPGVRDRFGVGPLNHPNWRNGVRIGPLDEDRITAFIPPFEREDRVYQGTAGEGVAVDAEGNVYAAEGPNSLTQAGGAFTKYA